MASEHVEVTGLDWVRGTEEPLETFGRELNRIAWEDVALDDRAAFAESLRSTGLSETAVVEALGVRDSAAVDVAEAAKGLEPYKGVHFFVSPPEYIKAQNVYYDARQSALSKLQDWWRHRVTVVAAVEPVIVRVPLFVLGAPAHPGCKAEWTNEITSGFSQGWTLKVAGAGLGSDAGSSYVSSASFEASSGQTKLIYCDVSLQLEHIEIREPDTAPVRRWRIDLTAAAEHALQPGLLLLEPTAVPQQGDYITTYPLAGDPSGSSATFTKKYVRTKSTKVDLGLSVHGTQLGFSATSDFESGVEVKYTLRSGVDYPLYFARDCDGMLFGATPASAQ